MGSNNHNDMGGHLVPYGKRKAGGRSKLKCIYYSKVDNYCRKKEVRCFGASCVYYREQTERETLSANKNTPKDDKKQKLFPPPLPVDTLVTHRNFGDGRIVESYTSHSTYIVVHFYKDNKDRKIPIPQSLANGMLQPKK